MDTALDSLGPPFLLRSVCLGTNRGVAMGGNANYRMLASRLRCYTMQRAMRLRIEIALANAIDRVLAVGAEIAGIRLARVPSSSKPKTR